MAQIRFRAMGCSMAAFIDSDGPRAAAMIREVPDWFEEWEQALSRFRADSELSRLNASGGLPFWASPILCEVVQAALVAARWSEGLVAPNLLSSLERAGYDRSFELLHMKESRTFASSSPPETAVEGDWRDINLDPSNRMILTPPGMKIDLGGIGKGWAANAAARRLSEIGPALVNAGGDIAASGFRSDGTPWQVAIEDPMSVEENLGTLMLGAGGVATSGVDRRLWLKDGVWKHHIIDPRTHEPAETDLVSATVMAPDLLQAEAAAKTVMILGSQAGLAWIEERFPLVALLACRDGRIIYSIGLEEYLWSENG